MLKNKENSRNKVHCMTEKSLHQEDVAILNIASKYKPQQM